MDLADVDVSFDNNLDTNSFSKLCDTIGIIWLADSVLAVWAETLGSVVPLAMF